MSAMLSLFSKGVSLAEKLASLQNASPLGAYLDEEELANLAKLCTTEKIKPGKALPEAPFYIVVSGEVVVTNIEDNVELCTKHPGSFFTRRAGLVAKVAEPSGRKSRVSLDRKSIVKSSSNVFADIDAESVTTLIGRRSGKVLLLSPHNLAQWLTTLTPGHQGVVNDILKTNIGTQLSQVPFIQQAGLEPTQLRALGEISSYAVFSEGKTIFEQGDDSDKFFIILKGSVDISIDVKALRGTGEGKVSASSRQVGDSFGVAALVYRGASRKYSATASERTLCLVISKLHFNKFLATSNELERALMQTTKEFLLTRYAAMNVPIFGHITDALRKDAAKLSEFVHFDDGEVIYKQGDNPHAFYVVLHGAVKMRTEGGAVVPEPPADGAASADGSLVRESRIIAANLMSQPAERELTVGQHFGEVGVLLPTTPCIATTTAVGSVTLLVLESSAFVQLFGNDSNLLSEMQIKLLRCTCTLKAVLGHNRARPMFEKHIDSEYSGESIKFYDAVEAFKKNVAKPDADAAALKAEAVEIIKEYVLDGSPQQVNIPSWQQKKIKAWQDSGAEVPDLIADLSVAQEEIYTLMARDNFPRFTKGKEFSDLLVEIGSYDAQVASLVSQEDLTMLVQDGESLYQAHLSA